MATENLAPVGIGYLATAVMLFVVGGRGLAQDVRIVYPPGAGVLNVVTDAGVDNTGRTDVTAQLQQILDDHQRAVRVIYFPDGEYRVSGQLLMKIDRSRTPASHSHGPWIVGQSRAGTVIRLADGTWPEPKYDLMTPDDKGRYPNRIDEQVVLNCGDATNTTFNKIIRNLTINIGRDNAGAIGVQYNTSNSGFMGEVDVISEDGRGLAAVALAGVENGPGQIRNIRTHGFDIGVYNVTDYATASSHIRITDPRRVGLLNAGFTVGENFTIRIEAAGVPAIRNVGRGMLCLVGAKLIGDAPDELAIVDSEGGETYLRDIRTRGFAGAIERGRHAIDEMHTGDSVGLFHNPGAALKLPIKPTPDLPDYETDFEKWANPIDFGAVGDGKTDDTEAFRRAFNAPGKTHVVIPHGRKFLVSDSIKVGPDVVRVVGTSGRILCYAETGARLMVEDGRSPVFVYEGVNGGPPIHVKTNRTVVISHARPRYQVPPHLKDKDDRARAKGEAGHGLYLEGGGEVFINDCPEPFVVDHPRQRVWLRHYNNEYRTIPPIMVAHVKRGSAWILAWKSENLGQRARVEKGGSLEIFSFNNYRVGKWPLDGDWPLFEILDGRFSCNILDQSGSDHNRQLVWETRDGQTRKLTIANSPTGRSVPLYTGYRP